ncbi:MAG: hypothetical protein ACLGIV_01520 [Actinomycetes bacterium]
MAIPLRDLLHPYVENGSHVLFVADDAADLVRRAALPEGVTATVGTSLADAEAGDVVVTTVAPDDDWDTVEAALTTLPAPCTLALLLAWTPMNLPGPRLVGTLTAAGCQAVDVTLVAVPGHPTGLVARRGSGLRVPAMYLGGHGDEPTDEDGAERLALRFANELLLVVLQNRQLRVHIDGLASTLRSERAELKAERERDLAARRQADERAAAAVEEARLLRARLNRLTDSRALRLGRAIAAARRPAGALRLPIELWRLVSRPRGAAGAPTRGS